MCIVLTHEIKSERVIIKAGQTLSHIYSKGHYIRFYGDRLFTHMVFEMVIE